MITVAEAKKIIKQSCSLSGPKTYSLNEASGLLLAKDVIAPFDIPFFVQSSMDGYAVCFDDAHSGQPLRVVSQSAAGNTEKLQLMAGEACRIFTGAPLPAGADTVIIQEKASISEGLLSFDDVQVQRGQFVRPVGAEIKRGQMALPAQHVLTPASISYLAAIGITKVSAYPFPVVSIIVTGNEFQTPGSAPEYGRIYESNGAGLKAALASAGVREVNLVHVPDALPPTIAALQKALSISDLVLLTGGVSVGDYDFVVAAANACEVTTGFHKIKQKPGKPLYFGMKRNIAVFGLPGNPSSVLTCFYEYVLIAIEAMCGLKLTLTSAQARLTGKIDKAAGLTHFMKAVVTDGEITALNAQESFRLSSFARANCLLIAPEQSTTLSAGEQVEIHLLP
jgi:molybdopterin molybdotransferase